MKKYRVYIKIDMYDINDAFIVDANTEKEAIDKAVDIYGFEKYFILDMVKDGDGEINVTVV